MTALERAIDAWRAAEAAEAAAQQATRDAWAALLRIQKRTA